MSAPLRLPAARGASLAADAWGDPGAPPLVLLHGGGQTRGSWGVAGARLAAHGWRVLALDLRGHGESDWAPDGDYDLALFADDVRAITTGLDAAPVLVGASLGGVSSLLAAGEAPQATVRALVLVDVAHRPEPAGVERILAFVGARPDGFASVEEAAAAIAAYLPHRGRPADLEGLRRNLRRRGDRWVWHWDPRLVERLAGRIAPPGSAERLLAAARAAAVATLLVRGGSSDVVSEEIAREFCDAVPGAQRVEVAGAGHMVAGDRNERFVDALMPFLHALTARDGQCSKKPAPVWRPRRPSSTWRRSSGAAR